MDELQYKALAVALQKLEKDLADGASPICYEQEELQAALHSIKLVQTIVEQNIECIDIMNAELNMTPSVSSK